MLFFHGNKFPFLVFFRTQLFPFRAAGLVSRLERFLRNGRNVENSVDFGQKSVIFAVI